MVSLFQMGVQTMTDSGNKKTSPQQGAQNKIKKPDELSEQALNEVAGGRRQITREEWERRAATNTFDKKK